MSRDAISDEAWAVIGPLFPNVKSTGLSPADRRTVVEATAWRFRTGAPWRDVPDRFGSWNTIYKTFDRWSEQGGWARVLDDPVSSELLKRGRLSALRGRGLGIQARAPARIHPEPTFAWPPS